MGYLLIDYIAIVDKTIYNSTLTELTGLGAFIVITIIVCMTIFFDKNFERIVVLKRNPYKMVYLVLKYAWKNKHLGKRSAFTHWENKIPSRIDLGKQKYGGPFTEEEVEDTKTFWRIVAVLLSTFGIFIPYYTIIFDVLSYINNLDGATTTLNGYGSFALWTGFGKIIIIIVPFLELIIIPLFPKIEFFFFNPLKWMGGSFVLLFITLSSMIVMDVINKTISFLYYIIPLSMIGIIDMISFASTF